jgi:hypothetical protein
MPILVEAQKGIRDPDVLKQFGELVRKAFEEMEAINC